jgi:ABC-type branched-subunit amino acid transport system substrate-binding protein
VKAARAAREACALLAAAAALAGCALVPGAGQPAASPEEKQAYARAVARVVDDPEGTRRALEAFLSEHPESPLADDARLRLAELALSRGDAEAARRSYDELIRRHPSGDRVDAARVELARLELARGQRAAAAAAIEPVRLSRLSGAELRTAYRVLAEVAEDPVERLRWLARVRGAEPDEQAVARVDAEIDELLAALGTAQLVSAAEQLGREIPAARTWLEAGERALAGGDLEHAEEWLARAARLPVAPAYEVRLAGAAERLRLRKAGPAPDVEVPTFAELAAAAPPDTRRAQGTLGVVLPLSGSFGRFGETSLQGVLLAAGVFGAEGAGPGVRVLVRDSAGRPERAAEAVRELAEAGVVAILGPLLAGECEAAAAAAESAGVPLLALTAREEVSASRPHVFRLRTLPSEEVEALVEHAMRDLGAARFAILYPRDAYGRGLRRLFWNAVEARGGAVVGVASYDPEATDFAGPIRKLVGYELLSPEEKKLLAVREEALRRARRLPPEEAGRQREELLRRTGPEGQPLPPIVDFDALFIPESFEKVVLIAPQLAFHEAVGITLLGPNGWYHPDLVALGREHVEGARFTAHFHSGSSLPFVRAFSERFEAAYAEAPDALAAQGFDAANLVLVQLARGQTSREAVREGVLRVRGFPGVTGVLSMRADGNARKRPFLLGVERGHITQIGVPAPPASQ